MGSKFTPERFVEVWMKSSSVKEVARKLRVSMPYVHQFATQLRNAGVELKKMQRGRQAKKIDVAGLNKIVEKHTEKDENEEPEAPTPSNIEGTSTGSSGLFSDYTHRFG